MFFNSRATSQPLQLSWSFLKWLSLCALIGVVTGSASAFFLFSLEFVTTTREHNPHLLYFLPFAGLLIAYLYTAHGKSVEAGNNLLLEEIHSPQKIVPLRMTPLVLLGTLLTHLFGGSAGREGTAVQMGGSLADQATRIFHLKHEDRKILLMMGIAGGFASVFGTPLAGAIFALEVLAIGRIRYQALLPCFAVAILAHFVCLQWGITHTPFPAIESVTTSWSVWLSIAVSGVVFGLCARLFSSSSHHLTHALQRYLKNPYARVFLGGLVVVLMTLALGTDRYLGLGVPVILESFTHSVSSFDFILKILFTVITLSAGFKGGEVTPLFFIGATLGSALAFILPLPVALLAAMGLTAVFAGAANTPIACILMGMELFGSASGLYIALAVVISYFCSGHRGIYHSQKIEVRKHA